MPRTDSTTRWNDGIITPVEVGNGGNPNSPTNPVYTSSAVPMIVGPGAALVTNYTFDPAARTVTLHEHPDLQLSQILAVIHVPTARVLYDLLAPGTSPRTETLTAGVLTLAGNMTGYNSSDELLISIMPGAAQPVDIGRLTEDESSIAIRNRPQEYGPYVLNTLNQVTPAIDVSRFVEVAIDFDLDNTVNDFIQFEFSTDGLTWANTGTAGYRGLQYFQRLRRFFRIKRITTSAKPITINRITCNATNSANGVGAIGSLYPALAMSNAFSGLNGLLQPMTSARAIADAGNGDLTLATAGFVQTGTNVFDRIRTPSMSRAASTATTGNTVVWTPTAGKKFRLTGYLIEITADAALAAAGVLVIKLFDGATDMNLTHRVRLPAAAGTGSGTLYQVHVPLGNGRASATANNALNLNLSAALTSGTVNVIALGLED